MKILVLTDHSGHSEHNSVYGLSKALSCHRDVSELFIASKGDSRNKMFFEDLESRCVYAVPCSDEFVYPANSFFEKEAIQVSLLDFDVLFLRLPRPIKEGFFTFLTDSCGDLIIVNKPSGILRTSNKSFLLNFNRYVEPMALCESWEDILSFAQNGACVLKPLEDYGGRGIVKIDGKKVSRNGQNIHLDDFYSMYLQDYQPYLAMKFLKNVEQGDKRIVVAGGKVLTSSLRKPAANGWLCNVAQGGTDEVSEPDEREMEIVDYIQPVLSQEGIFYYGLDTLVNDEGLRVISEINTLSIGGITPAETRSGQPLSTIFAALFIQYVKQQQV